MFLLRLVALAGAVSIITAKDCGTISRGKELKELVANANVLVALTSDEANTKDLCERLQSTPEARVQDLEIVTAADHNVQRKVWESSRPAPTGVMEQLWFKLETYVSPLRRVRDPAPLTTPAFVLFQKGASFDEDNGLRYTGDDMSVDAVTTFLASWLKTKKLGNYVYSLGTYDMIAAQTMAWVQKYSTDGLVPRIWVHGVGRLTRYLVQPTSMEFESQLAQMYINSAVKVLQNGPNYPQSQIDRLERMLSDDESKITPIQREELSQRLFIWKKFAEPTEVSSDDLYKFLGRLALNLVSVLAMAILIPLLIFGQEEYEEEEEPDAKDGNGDDEGHETNNDDDLNEADPSSQMSSSHNTSSMTKEEKRAAAIQRAKESMEADKKKVEALKSKKQQGASSQETSSQNYSRDELNEMTVLQLRDILKEQNKKVSGNKSDLVDRVLGEE